MTTQQQQWFDERHDYAGSSIGFRVNQKLHAEQTPFQSIEIWEHSSNAGGLIRWPIKFVLPLGFALLFLQGISELIKRVASLAGHSIPDLEANYERPLQ